MFGLGLVELLILLAIFAVGGPILLAFLLTVLLSKKNSSNAEVTIAQLEEENRRLRNALAASKSNNTVS